jgi:hypothetical protein
MPGKISKTSRGVEEMNNDAEIAKNVKYNLLAYISYYDPWKAPEQWHYGNKVWMGVMRTMLHFVGYSGPGLGPNTDARDLHEITSKFFGLPNPFEEYDEWKKKLDEMLEE